MFSQTMYVPIGEYGILSVGKIRGSFTETDQRFAELLARNARVGFERVEREQRLRASRETLRRQNERLDEFASVVAHDLRNPLSVARGAFETYRTTGDDGFVEDVEYAHGWSVAAERSPEDGARVAIGDVTAVEGVGDSDPIVARQWGRDE